MVNGTIKKKEDYLALIPFYALSLQNDARLKDLYEYSRLIWLEDIKDQHKDCGNIFDQNIREFADRGG